MRDRDIEKTNRQLMELARDWNDPDFAFVQDVADGLRVALDSGRRLCDIFEILKKNGFGGNEKKLSSILQELGLREKKKGKAPRMWKSIKDLDVQKEERREKQEPVRVEVQKAKRERKRDVSPKRGKRDWASGTKIFGAPVKTDALEQMETEKSGNPLALADILAVYDDVAEGKLKE